MDHEFRQFAVGVNNERPMLFETKGASEYCEGKEPNSLAIGARIEVTRDDSTKTTREIQAGSGYFSQNSAVQLFGLGKDERASIRVVWPNGKINVKSSVQCGSVTLNQ